MTPNPDNRMSGEKPDNKVIEMRPEPFPATPRRKPWGNCVNSCKGVWVDETFRRIECKTCGAIIDAFDYLFKLATDGDNLHAELRRLKEQVQTERNMITLLKEEVQTLKADRRRVSKGMEPLPPKPDAKNITPITSP